jgi:acyl-CoA synthetase (NDP forming)
MRSGTSSAGARAAASHTAALAGSDAVVDALFRQAGVLRAPTLQDLLDTAVLLTTLPAPTGNRVAVVTNAGGLEILCADDCEGAGLVLPELTAGRAALAEVTPSSRVLRTRSICSARQPLRRTNARCRRFSAIPTSMP